MMQIEQVNKPISPFEAFDRRVQVIDESRVIRLNIHTKYMVANKTSTEFWSGDQRIEPYSTDFLVLEGEREQVKL